MERREPGGRPRRFSALEPAGGASQRASSGVPRSGSRPSSGQRTTGGRRPSGSSAAGRRSPVPNVSERRVAGSSAGGGGGGAGDVAADWRDLGKRTVSRMVATSANIMGDLVSREGEHAGHTQNPQARKAWLQTVFTKHVQRNGKLALRDLGRVLQKTLVRMESQQRPGQRLTSSPTHSGVQTRSTTQQSPPAPRVESKDGSSGPELSEALLRFRVPAKNLLACLIPDGSEPLNNPEQLAAVLQHCARDEQKEELKKLATTFWGNKHFQGFIRKKGGSLLRNAVLRSLGVPVGDSHSSVALLEAAEVIASKVAPKVTHQDLQQSLQTVVESNPDLLKLEPIQKLVSPRASPNNGPPPTLRQPSPGKQPDTADSAIPFELFHRLWVDMVESRETPVADPFRRRRDSVTGLAASRRVRQVAQNDSTGVGGEMVTVSVLDEDEEAALPPLQLNPVKLRASQPATGPASSALSVPSKLPFRLIRQRQRESLSESTDVRSGTQPTHSATDSLTSPLSDIQPPHSASPAGDTDASLHVLVTPPSPIDERDIRSRLPQLQTDQTFAPDTIHQQQQQQQQHHSPATQQQGSHPLTSTDSHADSLRRLLGVGSAEREAVAVATMDQMPGSVMDEQDQEDSQSPMLLAGGPPDPSTAARINSLLISPEAVDISVADVTMAGGDAYTDRDPAIDASSPPAASHREGVWATRVAQRRSSQDHTQRTDAGAGRINSATQQSGGTLGPGATAAAAAADNTNTAGDSVRTDSAQPVVPAAGEDSAAQLQPYFDDHSYGNRPDDWVSPIGAVHVLSERIGDRIQVAVREVTTAVENGAETINENVLVHTATSFHYFSESVLMVFHICTVMVLIPLITATVFIALQLPIEWPTTFFYFLGIWMGLSMLVSLLFGCLYGINDYRSISNQAENRPEAGQDVRSRLETEEEYQRRLDESYMLEMFDWQDAAAGADNKMGLGIRPGVPFVHISGRVCVMEGNQLRFLSEDELTRVPLMEAGDAAGTTSHDIKNNVTGGGNNNNNNNANIIDYNNSGSNPEVDSKIGMHSGNMNAALDSQQGSAQGTPEQAVLPPHHRRDSIHNAGYGQAGYAQPLGYDEHQPLPYSPSHHPPVYPAGPHHARSRSRVAADRARAHRMTAPFPNNARSPTSQRAYQYPMPHTHTHMSYYDPGARGMYARDDTGMAVYRPAPPLTNWHHQHQGMRPSARRDLMAPRRSLTAAGPAIYASGGRGGLPPEGRTRGWSTHSTNTDAAEGGVGAGGGAGAVPEDRVSVVDGSRASGLPTVGLNSVEATSLINKGVAKKPVATVPLSRAVAQASANPPLRLPTRSVTSLPDASTDSLRAGRSIRSGQVRVPHRIGRFAGNDGVVPRGPDPLGAAGAAGTRPGMRLGRPMGVRYGVSRHHGYRPRFGTTPSTALQGASRRTVTSYLRGLDMELLNDGDIAVHPLPSTRTTASATSGPAAAGSDAAEGPRRVASPRVSQLINQRVRQQRLLAAIRERPRTAENTTVAGGA